MGESGAETVTSAAGSDALHRSNAAVSAFKDVGRLFMLGYFGDQYCGGC
jgi:hypothetical protein